MKIRKILTKSERDSARASALEEAATKKWMEEIGIPLLRKDLQRLEGRIKAKREDRNSIIFETLEFAAQIAELAEKKQNADHGAANTGGASLTARVIRAYAMGFEGYQNPDH